MKSFQDLPALKGEGGWTEVAGCPVFTNDDGAKGVQAMTDILAANPDLDAFAIEGGWPLFGAPQPYRDLFRPMADKIASGEFVITVVGGIAVRPARVGSRRDQTHLVLVGDPRAGRDGEARLLAQEGHRVGRDVVPEQVDASAPGFEPRRRPSRRAPAVTSAAG